MSYYTDDELMDAVRKQLSSDSNFRRQVEEAVNARRTVQLRRLIVDVAEIYFGRFIGSRVDAILDWFLN